MTSTICIDPRFRGPPESGNGGYVAGLLARALGASDCRVRLHRPPPLATPLAVMTDTDGVRLMHGGELIATAAPASVEVEAPPPVTMAEARKARSRFTGFRRHVFPGCFVCGPQREEGDGLLIFPGACTGGAVSAPWRPTPDLRGEDGLIRSEFVWAALDCPGYFAVEDQAGPAVLGEMAVRIHALPAGEEPLVVVGWHVASEGRKHRAGTAIFDGAALVASAASTWVSLRRAA